jgi:hypothetical protein
MDKLTKIINPMAMGKCISTMDHCIWDYFRMEKLTVKEPSFLVMALFTREISLIMLLVQKRLIINQVSLSITEALRTTHLIVMDKKKEEITNLLAHMNRAIKYKDCLPGIVIVKNILTKDILIPTINFIVGVYISLYRSFKRS